MFEFKISFPKMQLFYKNIIDNGDYKVIFTRFKFKQDVISKDILNKTIFLFKDKTPLVIKIDSKKINTYSMEKEPNRR